jgi:hypothetical protein
MHTFINRVVTNLDNQLDTLSNTMERNDTTYIATRASKAEAKRNARLAHLRSLTTADIRAEVTAELAKEDRLTYTKESYV